MCFGDGTNHQGALNELLGQRNRAVGMCPRREVEGWVLPPGWGACALCTWECGPASFPQPQDVACPVLSPPPVLLPQGQGVSESPPSSRRGMAVPGQEKWGGVLLSPYPSLLPSSILLPPGPHLLRNETQRDGKKGYRDPSSREMGPCTDT